MKGCNGAAVAIELGNIRDLLLPGLMEIRSTYATLPAWEHLFDEGLVVQQPLSLISPQAALAMAAAAAIIKNPIISRRGLFAAYRQR